jgi:death-on-curing protein
VSGDEPSFLNREAIDEIHEWQIATYGGSYGLRDENGLESAIAAPQNIYYYEDADIFELAAAYLYHLAESQAYVDGNKRTALHAATIFLENAGIDTGLLDSSTLYDVLIQVANHQMDRRDVARYLRSALS